MLTASDITARYKSDVQFVKSLHENGMITRSELDDMIEKLDDKWESQIEMLDIVTPTSTLERILAYS